MSTDPLRNAATTSRSRRRFLRTAGALGLAGTAGCLDALGFSQQSARAPPVPENRPDAVYHPSHVEAMEMVGMEQVGPYAIALSYGFPHRFWTVTGENRTKVEIQRNDSMHLMASVWHAETGTALPTATTSVIAERDGETAVDRTPWTMLSQRMGFHFGDNVSLPEAGSYDVTVGVEPIGTRATGAFRETFGERRTAAYTLKFDPETVRGLEFANFPDEAGTKGALGPMDMPAAQNAQLPEPGDLPGRAVGRATSGDGVFVVRALDAPPSGIDAEGTYLAVSPRTPYNRYPLAMISLSATVDRGEETVFEGPLRTTLDPGLGYHLGATVDSLRSGDEVTITVDAPPQVSRHEGYETAFFETAPMTIDV